MSLSGYHDWEADKWEFVYDLPANPSESTGDISPVGPEPQSPLEGLANFGLSLIRGIFGLVGDAISGGLQLGAAIVGAVVGGAVSLIGGVVDFIGNLFFGWNGREKKPLPPIYSDIFTDIEAATQPFFDVVDKNLQDIELLSGDLEDARADLDSKLDVVAEDIRNAELALEAVGDVDKKIADQALIHTQEAAKALGEARDAMDALTSYKSSNDAEISALKQQAQEALNQAGDALTEYDTLSQDHEALKSEATGSIDALKQLTQKHNYSLGTIESDLPGMKTAITTAQAKADETQRNLDNLEIGGRNLFLASKPEVTNDRYPTISLYFAEGQAPKDGEQVTLSLRLDVSEGATHISLHNSGGSYGLGSWPVSRIDNNGLFRRTFAWKEYEGSSNTYLNVYIVHSGDRQPVTLHWAKLERGNKATDWSPAPEDVESGIYAAQLEAAKAKAAADAAVVETTVEYAVSSSETTAPTSGWSANTPTRTPGSFVWMRSIVTYGSGSTTTTSPVLVTGNTGAKGTDGVAGKDGVGLESTVVMYAVSSNGTTPPTSGWQIAVPTLTQGNYLWTRTVWAYSDGSTEAGHSVAYLAKDGSDGNDGLPGKDGVGIVDTVITYAASSSGTTPPSAGWAANPPAGSPGQFIWTRTEWHYSDKTSETGYSVGKIGNTGAKGDRGSDGIPGKDGVGLRTTAVTYAMSTSGTTTPSSGWSTTVPTLTKGRYLWTKTVWTYSDDSSETGYSVSYIPTDGSNGTDGLPGKDGVSITSTTITYAKSSSGTTPPGSGWSSQPPATSPGDFVWTRTVWGYSDNTSETGYSIGKIGNTGAKGDQGIQGVPGPKGVDGKTTYTWIKYADSASGAGLSDSPVGKTYIGFSYNQTTATESTVASDYTWALIQGPQGNQGVQGPKGTDGKTTYTWVKYSDNANGSGLYDVPKASTKYIGIAVNKTTATESSTASDYTWSLFRGEDGVGVSSTAITYASSTSGTTTPTSGWQSTVPSVAAGSFLWTRTITTYTDGSSSTSYSTARQGANGAKGVPGDQGISVSSVVPHYQLVGIGSSAPARPTSANPAGWTTVEPGYVADRELYRTEQVTYSNGAVAFTEVTRVSAYTAASEANKLIPGMQEAITTAHGKAEEAQRNLDNLQIGGRNLVRNSEHVVDRLGSASGSRREYYAHPITGGYDDLEDGDAVTVSFDMEVVVGTVPVQIQVYNTNTRGPLRFMDSLKRYSDIPVGETLKTRVELQSRVVARPKEEINRDGNYLEFYSIYGTDNFFKITNLKVEHGNKATDWSPAPEDVDKSIADAQAKADAAVADTVTEYSVSSSETSAPTTGWSTSTPTRTPGSFIWIRTTITYGSGQTTQTAPALLTGNDGKPSYFHVAYANNSSGTSGFSTTDPNGRDYVGTYTDFVEDDSTDPKKYTWQLVKGADGSPGKGVQSSVVTYQSSTSGTATPTGTWSSTIPTVAQGSVLWTRTVTTFTDGATTTAYSVSRQGVDGARGPQGVAGPKGADGVTTYTWIKYADSASGAGLVNDPAGKTYIGFAYNKTTATESTNPADYTWSLIKGEKGDQGNQGIPGPKGADGQPTYTWVKYSDVASGASPYDVPKASTKYIGIAVNKTTQTESSNPADYAWSQFRGEDGRGVSSTAVTYASSTSGTTTPSSWSSTIPTVAAGSFLWTRTVITYTDSTTSTAYSIARQGANGANGSPGAKGADGKTSYLHVAYAGNSTGTSNFSTTDPTGREWVGTYTDFTEADSTDPAKYSWQLVKGADGQNGKGVQSTTVTYAGSTSGTTIPTSGWQSTIPTVAQGRFLWTRTVTTFTDGATSTAYINARQGANGSDGISVTAVVPYYQLVNKGAAAPAKPTTASPSGWTTVEPAFEPGKELYRSDRVTFSSGTTSWTDVSKVSAYTAAENVQTNLDNLEIGGRNLLLDSKKDRGGGRFHEILTWEDLRDHVGAKVTVSAEFKGTGPGQISIYPYQNHGLTVTGTLMIPLTENWTRVSWQGTVVDYGINSSTWTKGGIAVYGTTADTKIDSREWKIERGDKATDWSPAPEDVDQAVSVVLSKTEAINQALTGTVNGDLSAAINNASTAIGAIKASATKAEDWTTANDADFRKAVSLFTAAQGKVNDINKIAWLSQTEWNTEKGKIDDAQTKAILANAKINDSQDGLIAANNKAIRAQNTALTAQQRILDMAYPGASLVGHYDELVNVGTEDEPDLRKRPYWAGATTPMKGSSGDPELFWRFPTSESFTQSEWYSQMNSPGEQLTVPSSPSGSYKVTFKLRTSGSVVLQALAATPDMKTGSSTWVGKKGVEGTHSNFLFQNVDTSGQWVDVEFQLELTEIADRVRFLIAPIGNSSSGNVGDIADLDIFPIVPSQMKVNEGFANAIEANVKAIRLAFPDMNLDPKGTNGHPMWSSGSTVTVVTSGNPGGRDPAYRVAGSTASRGGLMDFQPDIREYRIRGWVTPGSGTAPSLAITVLNPSGALIVEAWRPTFPADKDSTSAEDSLKDYDEVKWTTSSSVTLTPASGMLGSPGEWAELDIVVRLKAGETSGRLRLTGVSTTNNWVLVNDLRLTTLNPSQWQTDYAQNRALTGLKEAFKTQQTVNTTQDELNSKLADSQQSLLASLRELQGAIWRVFPVDNLAFNSATELSTHIQVRKGNSTNIYVDARGVSWTGDMIITGFYDAGPPFVSVVKVTPGVTGRTNNVPRRQYFDGANRDIKHVRVDFRVDPERILATKVMENFDPGRDPVLVSALEFDPNKTAAAAPNNGVDGVFTDAEAKSPVVHYIDWEVVWDATTADDSYLMEVGISSSSGNSRSLKFLRVDGPGPTFPWQNGRRTTTINVSANLSRGDKLTFAIWSSAGQSSQRKVAKTTRTVSWMKP